MVFILTPLGVHEYENCFPVLVWNVIPACSATASHTIENAVM